MIEQKSNGLRKQETDIWRITQDFRICKCVRDWENLNMAATLTCFMS